jgi:hypothetical protein
MANTKVTGDVIANGTISTVHIADDAITAAKLDSTATGITFADLAVSGNSTLTGNVQVGSTAGYTTISQGAFFTKGGGDMYTANLLAGAAVSSMFKLQRNDVEKYNIGLDGNDNLAFINASGDAKMSIDSSGNLTVNNGNVQLVDSNKRITVDGSDIRIWQRSAANIQFLTNDLERMRIISSGNVGIGETSPDAKMHITSTSGDHLRLAYSDGYYWDIARESADGRLSFTDNANGEAISILPSGSVGIGTTSPTRKLSVVKDTTITSGFNDISEFLDTTIGAGGSVSLNVGRSNSTKNLGKMAFKYAGSGSNSNAINWGFYDADNLMTLHASGNVGIGVTSPNCKLDVNGIISPRGNQIRLAGGTDANHFLQKVTTGYSGATVDGPMLQGHQGGELTTNNGGNSWSLRWATGGAVYIAGDLVMSKGADPRIYAGSGVGFNIDGEALYLNRYTSSDIAMVTGGGNVGIGTNSPAATLDVDDDNTGKIRLLRNGSTRVELSNNANEGELSLYRSSTAKTIYISSYYNSYFNGGNVGIGTTSPAQKLDVNGNIAIRDTYKIFFNHNTDTARYIGASSTNDLDIASNDDINYRSNYNRFWDGGTEFARLSGSTNSWIANGSNGKLGIGLTSPQSELDVNGTATVRGRLYMNTLVPLGIVYRFGQMNRSGGTTVTDAKATHGDAYQRLSTSSSGTMWFGPYTTFPPGNYIAHFRLKVASNSSTSNIIYMDVTNSVSTGINVSPSQFDASNQYKYFKIPFIIENSSSVVELRGLSFVSGITDLYLDHILILPG